MGLVGMSQVVPALLRTVGTGILEGLASWTCWDVLSCPEAIFGTRLILAVPDHPGLLR